MANLLGNPLVDTVVGIAGNVLDRIFPDPVKQQEARLELLKLQQSGALAELANDTELARMQAAINQEEAKNPKLFVSGWRPFVGWVCGVGFAIQVLGPLLEWFSALAGHPVKFPVLDPTLLITTLGGMLGIGGMRTYEKVKNVEGNR